MCRLVRRRPTWIARLSALTLVVALAFAFAFVASTGEAVASGTLHSGRTLARARVTPAGACPAARRAHARCRRRRRRRARAHIVCFTHRASGQRICRARVAQAPDLAALTGLRALLVPGAGGQPCPDTTLVPTPANLPTIQVATLCLINQFRAQHGLNMLQLNGDLQQSAERHTQDMVARDYFAHISPSGSSPMSRVQQTGYFDPNLNYLVGENIAWGTLTLSTPASIFDAWINSPDHLANILEPTYTDTGMAVAAQAPPSDSDGQQGATYTEDFAGRMHS